MLARSCCAAAALLLAPTAAMGQRNVFAVGRDSWNEASLVVQLGRDLLSEKRRLGLRADVNYARLDVSRAGWMYGSAHDGPVVRRKINVDQRSRAIGLWLSGSYMPMKWRVAPYVVGGIGLQDSYHHIGIPATDSVTVDGVFFPGTNDYGEHRSRFGAALNGGVGLRIHLGFLRLFSEMRQTAEPYLDDITQDYRRSYRVETFGARY